MDTYQEEMVFEECWISNPNNGWWSNEVIIDDSDEYDTDSDLSTEEVHVNNVISFSDQFDEIYDFDETYQDEKIDTHYYIGLPGYNPKTNTMVLLSDIKPHTFFHYPFELILKYVQELSIELVITPKVHIMQLHIGTDGVYNVVLKTFWLKIIQRKWKNIMKKRKEIINQRKLLKNMYLRQVNGKLNNFTDNFPILSGMLN